MSYSERKTNLRAWNASAGTSTATASGHAPTTTAAIKLPKYIQGENIQRVRVAVDTAPGAALTVSKLIFKNGTNTFAVATIGTNTAGSQVDATMTEAFSFIKQDVQPTVDFLGTSTASVNTASGVYTIFFDE
jgi:hypothetical protein